MNPYIRLETELAEAREEIRRLKALLMPPEGFQWPWRPGTNLTRYNQIVLYTLAKAKGPLTEKQLTRILDALTGREVGSRQVASTVHWMRKRLAEEGSSIVIHSRAHKGYWLDDESKALVLGERKDA